MIKKYGYYCIVLLLVIALGGLYIFDKHSIPSLQKDTTKTVEKKNETKK